MASGEKEEAGVRCQVPGARGRTRDWGAKGMVSGARCQGVKKNCLLPTANSPKATACAMPGTS